ncbi:MAG TPA: helix-turn-helix transcriptional regulator [Flavisolibacter sp.]|jgi:AraC-like DNA-binding protein|nr:helix-turn-helix transcriptional regulator [Flavisolibacter sp.]
MKITIRHTTHPALAQVVDYFLFFTQTGNSLYGYHTFPNTNLCLAIYQQNQIEHGRNEERNWYTVRAGGRMYASRLWGFHPMPLQVTIAAPVQQVCINFRAGALRHFTDKPYDDLLQSDRVFEEIFGKDAASVLPRLFEETDDQDRTTMLEMFLLQRLYSRKINPAIDWSIRRIYHTAGDIRIHELAEELQVSPSTLFRKFQAIVGQAPKDFIKTVRFRATLHSLLTHNGKLVQVGYQHHYYDQAHFIREFKQLAGLLPGEVRTHTAVLNNQFVFLHRHSA